jgi:tetratricopeptide (TPR) repeat protein
MVTNKNEGWVSMSLLVVAALVLLCGCSPPGPRALLKGERLIREGKHEQAIQQLQTATRLLPKNAQAWNHLGLAYHGAKQADPAARAYRQALMLDHNLAAARYNLGCLLLEQNDLQGATDQLTSYTLLVPNSADGWLKLGLGQLRARKPDLAEKSFKTALELQPQNAEALNGLGVIQIQRKRASDGLYYFNQALLHHPDYRPALLNAAVVNHQNAGSRSVALQKYRQYLGLQPRPSNWEVVNVTANQLEAELNPPAVQVTRVEPVVPKVTNLVLSHASTNQPARPASNVVVVRTSTVPATNFSRPAAQPNSALTNPPQVASKTPAVETSKPPQVASTTPAEIEVTRLQDELVIQPAQDVSVRLPSPAATRTNDVAAAVPSTSIPSTPMGSPPVSTQSKNEKRGLFSRLNPFGGKPKPASGITEPTALPEQSSTGKLMAAASPSSPVVVRPSPPPVPHYTYLSPAKPTAGRHEEALRYFTQGVKEQKAKRLSQAIAEYQKATKADPAYFEAYYNLGLASSESGAWQQSLGAYEYALALQPDSVDARYNFALALKKGGYPQDAADELQTILQKNPNETRAHLSLANLFAQQLNQPQLAREHYIKVLNTDPRHPQAAEIRYWLAANP